MASATKTTGENAATVLRGETLAVLQELLASNQKDEILALVEKLVSRNRELELLLARLREGKNRGERISAGQLDLFLEQLRAQAEDALAKASQRLEDTAREHGAKAQPEKPPKQPPVRRPPPAELRRIENLLAVPAAERACPRCGAERVCIGHETTEVIDLIPAEVVVRLDKREVLACEPCEAELVRAPMGDKVVTGGAYGSRLVAELIVGKYRDGLPLNRQKKNLEELGLPMPSSSMSDQIGWGTDLLRALWRAAMARVLVSKVMSLDGTGLPVRDRESPHGIVTGTLWGYVGDEEDALYLYASTGKKKGQREGEVGPEDFLSLRVGYVVADAAGVFDSSFADAARIEVGCNMHARRYFVKALEAGDARAAVPLKAFQALYAVEDSVRGEPAERRREERQQRSRPVYDELLRWAAEHQPLEPPGTLLGKALTYLDNNQVALTRFLDDGVLPIDNGIVERLHRRPAMGRRAYLFAGSHAGAERAAIAYSILGSCALAEVDPREYLADVLPRLAREPITGAAAKALLPAAWKRARAAAAAATAAAA